MKYFNIITRKIICSIIFSLLFAGCMPPPSYNIRKSIVVDDFPEIECVRSTMLSTKGVKGVIFHRALTRPAASYIGHFSFETQLGIGTIQISKENYSFNKILISASTFGYKEYRSSTDIERSKAIYQTIIDNIKSNCSVVSK